MSAARLLELYRGAEPTEDEQRRGWHWCAPLIHGPVWLPRRVIDKCQVCGFCPHMVGPVC